MDNWQGVCLHAPVEGLVSIRNIAAPTSAILLWTSLKTSIAVGPLRGPGKACPRTNALETTHGF